MIVARSTSAAPFLLDDTAQRTAARRWPLMLYGVLAVVVGFAFYIATVVWEAVAFVAGSGFAPNGWLAFAAGVPVIGGLILVFIELVFQLPKKRANQRVHLEPVVNRNLTVVLTAYNDEASIGAAVADFRSCDLVRRVLVIDNNSTDGTAAAAANAGAVVHREFAPGYGNCVYRALQEAAAYTDTELVLLCEGDL